MKAKYIVRPTESYATMQIRGRNEKRLIEFNNRKERDTFLKANQYSLIACYLPCKPSIAAKLRLRIENKYI